MIVMARVRVKLMVRVRVKLMVRVRVVVVRVVVMVVVMVVVVVVVMVWRDGAGAAVQSCLLSGDGPTHAWNISFTPALAVPSALLISCADRADIGRGGSSPAGMVGGGSPGGITGGATLPTAPLVSASVPSGGGPAGSMGGAITPVVTLITAASSSSSSVLTLSWIRISDSSALDSGRLGFPRALAGLGLADSVAMAVNAADARLELLSIRRRLPMAIAAAFPVAVLPAFSESVGSVVSGPCSPDEHSTMPRSSSPSTSPSPSPSQSSAP